MNFCAPLPSHTKAPGESPAFGADRSEQQIDRPIVIEIGGMQAHFSRERGRVPELGNRSTPRASVIATSAPVSSTATRASVPAPLTSATVTAFTCGQIIRERKLAKYAASLVMKEMQHSRAIDHGGIGIAVAIQVDPGKAAQA